MDDEKRRRQALETGREMLEIYKLKRANKKLSKSVEQASDEESNSNETENRSIDLRSIDINESALSRDITYSSISMSEGEGDGDLEGLTGRVTELNEILQGKEAVFEELHAEFDHLETDVSSPTSSHSQNSNIPNKNIIETYRNKFQEFERAINQRDNLIEDLTTSLKQAIASRDGLLSQISVLNSTQLGISNGENAYDGKDSAIANTSYSEKEMNTNSMENTNNFGTNQLQKQCEEQVEKIKKETKLIIEKFVTETNTNNLKHENEIQELMAKHEVELQKLRDKNEENEHCYSKKLSDFQSQIIEYQHNIESLKFDLINIKESHTVEKELLNEQIKLHKLQLEDMTTKYVATASVLDSKESIELSLDQALNDANILKAEKESLKFKLDDLMSRYLDAQNLIKSGQIQERNLSNKIFSIRKSSSALSRVSLTEMDETAYQSIDEMAFQNQMAKQILDEKANLEKELIDKIDNYDKLVAKMEEAKEGYEKQIKDLKNTCDQLKNKTGSNVEVDQQQQRFSADSLDVAQMPSCAFEQEINALKKIIEARDETVANYIKKLDKFSEINQKLVEESNKLKAGLASAYAECAVIEEKLDETLGFGETKLGDSTMLIEQTGSPDSSTLNLEELLHKQTNYNKVLQKLDSCRQQFENYEKERSELLHEIETKTNDQKELLQKAQQKEEDYREEIKLLKMEASTESQRFEQLLLSFEEREIRLKQSIADMEIKHTQEVEELRKYFEQKCLHMEKQYSEEVFSLQSRKMSDNDSEIEDLTEDLYVGGSTVNCLGGGGDALGVLEKEMKADHLSTVLSTAFNSEEQKNSFNERIISDYEEKLENLRKQLEEVKDKPGRTILVKAINQFCQTEQSCTTGVESNELNELRADYNRQLKEQVGLARIDIINALQEQIEALITVESESDENWPTELLELRNKFTSNAERKFQTLKERHGQEIKRLKEGNNKIIHDLQEEIKRLKTETHESLQSNLIQERDILQKTCVTLKDLVSQLIAYFNECEEELNSTLINEVLKKQFIIRSDSNLPFDGDQISKSKRVHFAPQSDEIASIIGSDNNLQNLVNREQDIKKLLQSDLDACLQRLKTDSAKILNVSYSDTESWSTGPSDNPVDKLMEVEKLLANFQEENEHLKVKIIDLQQRLLLAESKKEVISEGYGVQDETGCKELQEDFSELQDRAKYVVSNGSNDTGYLIQLIEELYKHADKISEDMKREKEDLQHQIEAADKQLRSTRKFQEEQAVEREAERDEATKQIQQLQERLREREREKDRDYRITSAEVEGLTSQLREMEMKKIESENELKTAVTKIWELREIICDLDQQVQLRSEKEDILNNQIEHLKEIIISQTRNQEKLVQELEVVKSGNESNQLSNHIGHLQEELRKHQLSSEQLTANSSALKQLRLEIRDMQAQVDRKTRELESLHVCGSSLSLSQPSEDVSIREQIEATRCPTPDDPSLPLVLPLDHLLKLKETLLKHFRAEDVALKRLKDLDIQYSSLQKQNEELLAEQEILQQTTSEQLFQIETLRARLEQQKQNAPFAQRQATSRLESQLYEMNDKLESTERALVEKDMELAETKDQLEHMSRILAEKEVEIANVVQSENDIIQKLKDKLEVVEEEKRIMKAKLNIQEKNQSNLPQLIDTMLAEKNEEIEHLKQQVIQREKQLDIYLSLDEIQLRELLHQNEQKNSARTLSDILSIKSDCEISEAIREAPNFSKLQNTSNLKMPNTIAHSVVSQSKKDVVDFSQEIVETPKVPRLNLESISYSSDGITSNIVEISKEIESLQMYVREKISLAPVSPSAETDTDIHEEISEDPNNFVCPRHDKVNKNNNEIIEQELTTVQRLKDLEMFLSEIKSELENKSIILKQRDAELLEIQNNLQQLQENIESLNQDRLYYKAEYEMAKMNETKIQKDLEEVENILKKKTEELEEFKGKIQMNEQILYKETKRSKVSESTLQENYKEIGNLRDILAQKDISIENLQIRNAQIEKEIKDLYDYRRKFDTYEQEILEYQNEIQRLSDALNSRDQMIRRLEEITRRSSLSGGSSPSEKDQEIYHLQEYLKEKDKVIRQMSDDSKSLHCALETIQSKMKESGNIVELRKKLKEERKNNIELTEQIAKLKTEVEMLSSSRRAEEDNDIAEMVQRELNLSARLDQQLLNVIDGEPENMLQKCEDLKQAKKEIDELNRFKDDLEIEREMLKSQICEYENRIMQLKSDAEEEAIKIVRLEEDLSKERHLVRSLQMQLQREKNIVEEDKLKDTELISQLRIKLDEALEVKDRLVMEQKNIELMHAMKDLDKDSSTDLQDQLKKELLILTEKLEIEQRKCEELRDNLQKLSNEKEHGQKQYETVEAEIKKLTSTIEFTDSLKEQLKSDLKRAKEELKAKNEECNWQKSLLKTMNDADNKRNQRRTNEHSELKSLRRELKNAQEVMLDFQIDMKTLNKQLSESGERESQLSRRVESLMDKETELTEQLNAIKKENKKLKSIIVDQKNEIKMYLRREIDLTEELKKERSFPDKFSSPSKIFQNAKDLTASIEKLSHDKMCLKEENDRQLDQIRVLEAQLSQMHRNNQCSSKSDVQERMQYFYGKYLRFESRIKSLIYQKKYLLCILVSFERIEENSLATLAQLTDKQREISRGGTHHRYNPRIRFRTVVLFLVAIQRMKWLVLRWRTGLRVGANVVLNIESQLISQPRYRNVGTTERSPPIRDRHYDGLSGFSHDPYLRRFNSIQQNLHLTVPEQSNNNFKSN